MSHSHKKILIKYKCDECIEIMLDFYRSHRQISSDYILCSMCGCRIYGIYVIDHSVLCTELLKSCDLI